MIMVQKIEKSLDWMLKLIDEGLSEPEMWYFFSYITIGS